MGAFTQDTWEPLSSSSLPGAAKSNILQAGVNKFCLARGAGCWPWLDLLVPPQPLFTLLSVILSCPLPIAVLEGGSDRSRALRDGP